MNFSEVRAAVKEQPGKAKQDARPKRKHSGQSFQWLLAACAYGAAGTSRSMEKDGRNLLLRLFFLLSLLVLVCKDLASGDLT